MNGFIANTDLDWHARLLAQSRTGRPFEEVNFWRPSTRRFKSLRPGEPFLFRLKSPANAIGGFGFLQTDSPLPAWLAWDAFGRANGVESLREFETRLADIRSRNRMAPQGEQLIGCTLLVDAVFFEETEWVRLPSDWKMRTVSGKRYDLTFGEGARVWRDCLSRVSVRGAQLILDGEDEGARFGTPQLVRPRLGQGGFRVAVMDAYRRSCAVTTEHSLPVLDAAHIRPYADTGDHDVRNGLLLRSDIHRLFDRGYVTVTPDLEFRVSPKLRTDYANGKTYYALEGRKVMVPEEDRFAPSREALDWHSTERFFR